MMLTLPWPPSVNRYWRNVRGRTLLSKEGRVYRQTVLSALQTRSQCFRGRLAVIIDAFPPDRRRRDLDNLLKGPLDALQAAGLYLDDSQIDRLTIERHGRVQDGRLEVHVVPIFGE